MHRMTSKTLDRLAFWLIVVLLTYSAIRLGAAVASGTPVGPWIWERHQNLFSWYSRPLFIIPAAYYAYRRKPWFIAGFMALLGTSLFWFSAPATVSPAVSAYLEWERQLFLANDSALPLIALVGAVIIFLLLFFYALWRRSLWLGLGLINAGTILKIIVSMTLGAEAGKAAIAPSVSSLIVINLVAWGLWRHWRRTH